MIIDTFESLVDLKSGTILEDGHENGVRYLIMRGPNSLCCYLGVPKDHPLANRSYDDIPLDCHGGLTFSEKGDGEIRPEGWFWYGWDYGHAGDVSFDDLKYTMISSDEHKWIVEDVKKEIWLVTHSFRKLMKLVESR